MLEGYLMRQAAPTLAGVKCGSLFKISLDPDALHQQMSRMNSVLNHHGVRVIVLRSSGREHLVYAFRPSMLSDILSDDRIFSFLSERGYDVVNVNRLVVSLKDRMVGSNGLVHEIGVFLGYPLEDVIGFIENEGLRYKSCGCWKVYGDIGTAQGLFCRIRECRDKYADMYRQGVPIVESMSTGDAARLAF
jgi:hypothetical protein